MGDERRNIPEPIKRAVRQRCGFGCVICGLPIYDYDHKPGFARVRRHVAEEITLLCPTHHAEKTRGLLTNAQVEAADLTPFNRGTGSTSPYSLWFGGTEPPIILMIGFTFTCVTDKRRPTWMWPLCLNGYKPFGFTLDEGGLLLNVDVRDSRHAQALVIRDSVMRVSSDVWDATLVGQTLTIREQAQSFLVEMDFNPPNVVRVNRYYCKAFGSQIDVKPDSITVSGGELPNVTDIGGIRSRVDANIGMLFGDKPLGMTAGIRVGA